MSAVEVIVKKTALNKTAVSGHGQLAKMLESDRIDVALIGTAFHNSPVFKVGVVSLIVATSDVFHVFNKRHARLIPEFDRYLLQMKKSGQYGKLLPSGSMRQTIR